MAAALYGPAGFYRTAGAPGRHFRTAAHTGAVWARAIARLVDRVDVALGRPDDFTVVEMGAGGGELLAGLAALGPDRWSLVGVDVAPRPAGLPAQLDWRDETPASFAGVLLAVEWLDVVPVDVVERTEDGARIVEVNDAGEERLGPLLVAEDRDWLARWWPLPEVGDRAEIGRPRDEAWRNAVARIDRGVAVAVDYAAVPARDVAGTLTGYQEGRQVVPVPDGSMDITAHVRFESLVADTERVVLSQRDALRRLGVDGRRPSYDGEATSYLEDLSRAGDEAELIDPSGLGAFTWLVQAIGTSNPLMHD
jgi:SAM-dependent MidA family methyltransferase